MMLKARIANFTGKLHIVLLVLRSRDIIAVTNKGTVGQLQPSQIYRYCDWAEQRFAEMIEKQKRAAEGMGIERTES